MGLRSDALLLADLRAGDEEAFEALFLRHYDMVYGVLFRLLGSREEAEDGAQEVFLKLYQRPAAHGQNVAGWLYRSALRLGLNRLRSDQRRARREQIAGPELHPLSPSAEAEAQRRADAALVRQALAQLKPRDASLLLLRELGYSYQEIAAMAGIAPGSVGQLLSRAQARLLKALGGAFDQEELR